MTDQDAARTKSRRKKTNVMGWVLMAMIVGGLGGFGVQNFGNGLQSIGSVGSQEISVNAYALSLRNELKSLSQQVGSELTLTQAAPFGVAERALAGLIGQTALDGEAARLGLSVGDAVLADQLASVQAFQGVTGVFDAAIYRDTLARNNLAEDEYEDGMRRDIARQLLQAAVSGGVVAPAALTERLYGWAAERRGFSMLTLTEAALPAPLPAPTEAQLTTWYTDHIADYTRGEAKRITYATMLPDSMAKDIAVDEAAVKAMYVARVAEFQIPERRLVERLIYPDQAAADAARAELDGGASFETLVAARNLSLEDIDLGDVAIADLGAAGDAVFGQTEVGGVAGPVMTDLGPALFRMNGILQAQETTYDEARPALAAEWQAQAARADIGARIEALDDLLAGGATLEDLAKEGMVLATTNYVAGAQDNDSIAGYTAFRKAADALAEGDYPEIIGLDDGGIVAMRLDEILPPAPIAQAEVTDRLTESWHADQLATALAAFAEATKAKVMAGTAIGSLGIVTTSPMAEREALVSGAPSQMMAEVFAMAPGEVRVVAEGGSVVLVQLNSITPAAASGDEAEATRASIGGMLQSAIARDLLQTYTQALTTDAGLTLDEAAMNAVKASFN